MGTKEEAIQNDLTGKFSFLAGKIRIQRERRIFADAPVAEIRNVIKYALDKEGFIFLCTISGLDEGENLSFIYHLTRYDGIILSLKIGVPKQNPVIKTITDYFKGADIYEREAMDLLGVRIEGLPEGKRYPLPDDWPQGEYPLRKDWKKK